MQENGTVISNRKLHKHHKQDLERWHTYSHGMWLLLIKIVAKNQNYYASLSHFSPFPSAIE